MQGFLYFIQIGSAIILSGLILLQVKGTGFGRVWGGSGNSFSRRGLESLVFKSTFVITGIFTLVSILSLII